MPVMRIQTSQARARVDRGHPEQPAPLVLGMVLFIASEIIFFGSLFAAYYTLRSATPVWPPPDALAAFTSPARFQATVASLILWGSSVPAHLAVQSMHRQDFGAMRRWILLTIGMGIVFMGWKFSEWATSPFSVSTHAYGTIFFGLTGFHALHLVVGLILLSALVARIAQGAYRDGDQSGPEAVAYYWHFVDAVWVAVFATIYLVR
jgi:cytochrome c oxidase subunit III